MCPATSWRRAKRPTWRSTPPARPSCNAVDRAIQTHGGNGLANEYGLVQMLAGSRLSRIAPVSKEMVLNFIAQFSLGLP